MGVLPWYMVDEATRMDAHAAMPALVEMSTGDAQDHGGARELILQVRSGDRDAFEILMRRHERLVLGTAMRLLWRSDDAKDAAQDVFLRLFRYAGSLDPDQPLEPWLYRVTVNVCRDVMRQRVAARQVVAGGEPTAPAGSVRRIEFQTADPTIRIIWLMPEAGPGPNR